MGTMMKTRTSLLLLCALTVVGCGKFDNRRQKSLEGLNWSGGTPELKYVRDQLVRAIENSTAGSLRKPNLVSVCFLGQSPDGENAHITFDWIAYPPTADGADLQMKDGSTVKCMFHQAYVNENQKESEYNVICQASVGRALQPDLWDRIDVDAIESAQLTKNGEPVSNVCTFRRHPKKEENSQQQNGAAPP